MTRARQSSNLIHTKSNKNYIINGTFDFWQRASSQTISGYGSDDRWVNAHVGSTKTHSIQIFTLGQTDVPGNIRYFSRTVVTSVAGAGNYVIKQQKIEFVKTLQGKTATLSFWAKADANKNISVEFGQYFGTGGSPSAAVNNIGITTCALTTSWKKFVVTVDIPSISGKTIGTDNNDFLALNFWFDAGSNWNSRTNSLGQQSGTFDIAQVQLEEGSVATEFEYRSLAEELTLCQRYYEFGAISLHTTNLGAAQYFSRQFNIRKRNTPSVTTSGFSDNDGCGATNVSAYQVNAIGIWRVDLNAVPNAANKRVGFNFFADAEL